MFTFKLSQFDILRQCEADASSWYSIDAYPSMTLCRRIVKLADFASEDARRWQACRMRHECPELTLSELAIALGSNALHVARRLESVNLADRCDYDVVEYFGEVPDFLRAFTPGCPDETDVRRSRTYRNAVALCGYAAAEPLRYNTMRLTIVNGISQQMIAETLKISQQQVSKYLNNPIQIKD